MEGDQVTNSKNFYSRGKKFRKGLKKPAVAGAIIFTPFLASYMVFSWFLGIFRGIPGDEIFYVTSHPLLNEFFKASALTLFGGLLVVAVGKIASTGQGVKLEEMVDRIVMRIPVIGSVYSITKTATDTVLRRTQNFQHPVKLSYHGMKFTAFQTGENPDPGKKTVFVPTSPNITSGFVIEVSEDQLEETDDSLEQAFTRVLSAGFSN